MEQKTVISQWCIEVNNPLRSTDWQSLWKFGKDQYTAHQKLVKDLNQINYPIRIRIVPDPD